VRTVRESIHWRSYRPQLSFVNISYAENFIALFYCRPIMIVHVFNFAALINADSYLFRGWCGSQNVSYMWKMLWKMQFEGIYNVKLTPNIMSCFRKSWIIACKILFDNALLFAMLFLLWKSRHVTKLMVQMDFIWNHLFMVDILSLFKCTIQYVFKTQACTEWLLSFNYYATG